MPKDNGFEEDDEEDEVDIDEEFEDIEEEEDEFNENNDFVSKQIVRRQTKYMLVRLSHHDCWHETVNFEDQYVIHQYVLKINVPKLYI